MSPEPEWVRVARRGYFHTVQERRPTGAYQTKCGRIFAPEDILAWQRRHAPAAVHLCAKCEG